MHNARAPHTYVYTTSRRQWETRNFMSRSSFSRAGESRSEARGNISFGGPIDPENTSGGPTLYRPYSTANMNIFLCDMHVTY